MTDPVLQPIKDAATNAVNQVKSDVGTEARGFRAFIKAHAVLLVLSLAAVVGVVIILAS